MRDFLVFGHLMRWALAVILGLLLLGGIAVLRNWVVAQALAHTTDPPALVQGTAPALVPITTPIWGTVIPFQQWDLDWLDATPTPGPPSGGTIIIFPQR